MGCLQSTAAEPAARPLGRSGDSDVELNDKARETEARLEVAFKTKRQNVFTAGINMDGDSSHVKVKNIPKSEAQRNLILSALQNIFIFAAMAEEDLSTVVNAMERVEIPAGSDVITQGTAGDFFYIVERGTFSVIINGATVGELSDGKYFGELALLYDTNRQATIRCGHNTAVAYTLDRNTFRYIVAHSADDRRGEIQRALSKVPLLQGLTKQQIMKISDSVEIVKFNIGDYVIRKGSEGNIFYMIKEGTVRVVNVGANGQFSDHTLGPGDYFGERALITGEPRAADVLAESRVTVMALDRVLFNSLLGPIREVLDYNLNLRIIESIKLFSNLSDREKSKVSRSFEFESFPPGTTIVREGDKGRKFYIIKDGTATVSTGGQEVGQLIGGQYFGEMALLDDETRKATVVAATTCECFALDRPTFSKILGSIREALELESRDRKKELDTKSGEISRGASLDDSTAAVNPAASVEFKDLHPIAVLGSGTFGRVSLVQEKRSMNVYAMKAMLKKEIELHKQQNNVMNEKELMLACNHTFVLRLYKTFKDARRLYMLLEFVQGGELFTVLHTPRGDGVPDASAKFYGAGVLLGLIHMHQRDIAYRDMKPENCLVDKMGYPKIVDFGFAKIIRIGTKSYTLCGTPEYLAPEIVLGRGHDKGVDYWALGILLYEMEAGYSPFSDPQGMDQVVICRNIVNGRLNFPRNFNPDCKELVKKLLIRDPVTRLGNLRGGSEEIRQQKWFSDFDFDRMLSRQITAPWIPKIASVTDTSNFDPMEEAEVVDNNYVCRGNWDATF